MEMSDVDEPVRPKTHAPSMKIKISCSGRAQMTTNRSKIWFRINKVGFTTSRLACSTMPRMLRTRGKRSLRRFWPGLRRLRPGAPSAPVCTERRQPSTQYKAVSGLRTRPQFFKCVAGIDRTLSPFPIAIWQRRCGTFDPLCERGSIRLRHGLHPEA